MNGINFLQGISNIDDDLIEEAYIHTSAAHNSHRGKRWIKWGSMAACLICVGAAGITAYRLQLSSEPMNEAAISTYDVTSSYGPVTESFSSGTDDSAEQVQPYRIDASTEAECNLPSDSAPQLQAAAEDSTDAVVHDWSQYTIISEYPGDMNAVYCYAAPAKGTYFLYHYLETALSQNGTEDLPYAYKVSIQLFTYEKGSPDNATCLYGTTKEEQELITREYDRLLGLNLDVELSADYHITATLTKEELQSFPVSSEYGYTIGFANEQ